MGKNKESPWLSPQPVSPGSADLQLSTRWKRPQPMKSPARFASPMLKISDFSEDTRRRSRDESRATPASPGYIPLATAEEDDNEFYTDAPLMSVGESIFNLANTMIGSGVLSVPYAFKLSGYYTLPALFVVVGITVFTANLLGLALKAADGRAEVQSVAKEDRDYAFLGQLAFGSVGKVVVNTTTMLEMWLALITLIDMNASNLVAIAGPYGLTLNQAVVTCTILMAMMFRTPLRLYAYISLVSLCALVVASIAFALYLVKLPKWSVSVDDPISFSFSFGQLAQTVGLLVFCFAGHPCFPGVHEGMEEPKKWKVTTGAGFTAALLYYGILGTIAFMAIGSAIEPVFTLNLPQGSWLQRICTVCFLVKIQLTLPLIMRAIFIGLGISREHGHQKLIHTIMSCLGTAAFLCVTVVSAIRFSSILATLASLAGSLLVMLTSVLLPVFFYLRVGNEQTRPPVLMLFGCLFVVVFGCVAGCAGTYKAVSDVLISGN